MRGLLYTAIWLLDFEFLSEPGARPIPVCMVARELYSGRLIRLWQDEFGPEPPFPINDQTLIVAFFSSAEWGCFLALGWPLPTRILDLFVEFRNLTNGLTLPAGRGYLGALSHYHIPSITKEQKDDDRNLVMRGGPWTPQEQCRILDYCQTDVDPMGALLECMLPAIMARRNGLGQALLRARYMVAVARMEWIGVPIDVAMLEQQRAGRDTIKLDLVKAIDKDFGVYEGATFKTGLFVSYTVAKGIPWPRIESGALAIDDDTFHDMADRYPELRPLRYLRSFLSDLRPENLTVGPDGRNRTLLSPFGARTGRNTPAAGRFIYGQSSWRRGLITPPEGKFLAYVDYRCQEVMIAAVLSGDAALLEAVATGDPYLAFAKMAGLAPPDATKESHKEIRDMCKTCVLGANYGMGPVTLAQRTGLSVLEAQRLLDQLARAFPVYTKWADHIIDVGYLNGHLSTCFGWTLHVTETTRPNALRNFPMQATGAEMLRLACCLVTEAGIDVCAPLHDAILIEGDIDSMEETVASTRSLMADASRVVLNGVEVNTEVDLIVYPNRFAGGVMWGRVTELLAQKAGSSAPSKVSSRG